MFTEEVRLSTKEPTPVFPILLTFPFSTFPTFSGKDNEDIDDWIDSIINFQKNFK